MQFAEHSVSAAMVAAITESDSKRQKIERRMLLTSYGGPYLVSGIPGRVVQIFKELGYKFLVQKIGPRGNQFRRLCLFTS